MSSASPTPQRMRRMALVRLGAAVPLLGALFFLPAGTLRYWEAWVFMAVLFVPMAVFVAYLIRRSPAALERRLSMREEQPRQKWIVASASVVFLAAFLLPGFDRRFGWSSVPTWLVIAADVVILLGYLLFAVTLRANEFAARTVRVEEGQRVITTGPYARVRHPMYVAVLLIYLSAPLALGSYWALLPVALLPAFLAARALDEERVLREELDGYADYCKVVRYRMIPGVW